MQSILSTLGVGDAMTGQPSPSIAPAPPAPALHIAPAPHLFSGALTTRRMMADVLLALLPTAAMAVRWFGLYAVRQTGLCIISCVAFEALFTKMRRQPLALHDLSAAVTGAILGLSLPWSAPWYVAVIASGAAIGIGKIIFGGLGQNVFNPAMVGRAFVMISFAGSMGAGAYVAASGAPDIVTQATPMTAAKVGARELASLADLWPLLIGSHNGSLGEVSVLACLLGGLYLCLRRTAAWQIPLATLLAVVVVGGLGNLLAGPDTALPLLRYTVLQHLCSGAVVFGAFFIATDPVSSPLTPWGKFSFGLGVGALVMVIRFFSNYPEGVMFAVLMMNGLTPLLNRWTIPTPVGGPTPAPAPKQ
jgi:electron transport complex protein RnfD